jgi:hypothetical protein
LYRFNARSGEWKHASRLTRFPERRWLASLKWPQVADDDAAEAAPSLAAGSDDVDASGERAAHGAALRTPAAEIPRPRPISAAVIDPDSSSSRTMVRRVRPS